MEKETLEPFNPNPTQPIPIHAMYASTPFLRLLEEQQQEQELRCNE
jgi:hypothetical protein